MSPRAGWGCRSGARTTARSCSPRRRRSRRRCRRGRATAPPSPASRSPGRGDSETGDEDEREREQPDEQPVGERARDDGAADLGIAVGDLVDRVDGAVASALRLGPLLDPRRARLHGRGAGTRTLSPRQRRFRFVGLGQGTLMVLGCAHEHRRRARRPHGARRGGRAPLRRAKSRVSAPARRADARHAGRQHAHRHPRAAVPAHDRARRGRAADRRGRPRGRRSPRGIHSRPVRALASGDPAGDSRRARRGLGLRRAQHVRDGPGRRGVRAVPVDRARPVLQLRHGGEPVRALARAGGDRETGRDGLRGQLPRRRLLLRVGRGVADQRAVPVRRRAVQRRGDGRAPRRGARARAGGGARGADAGLRRGDRRRARVSADAPRRDGGARRPARLRRGDDVAALDRRAADGVRDHARPDDPRQVPRRRARDRRLRRPRGSHEPLRSVAPRRSTARGHLQQRGPDDGRRRRRADRLHARTRSSV